MGSRAIVYTLPDCQKCEELKKWLDEEGVEFEIKSFTTEVQLEFIMKNIFSNPPILQSEGVIASSEDLFSDESLKVEKAREVLGHS
ncbi:MAG: hypothetical protein PVJ38_06970 [Candidatus Bathyarchaeota archaeon]